MLDAALLTNGPSLPEERTALTNGPHMSNSVPLTNGDNTGMVGPEPSSKDPPVVEKRVRFAPQFVMADRFGEDTGTPPPPSVCLPPSLVSVSTGEHSDKAVQCDFDDIIWVDSWIEPRVSRLVQSKLLEVVINLARQ
ncbi:hypothetical protein BaRGS_00016722 [Batillaria attramentaria]|uniref:Uncharacterized protein n=1 Tax=Batillaria attramentaria TaxID=370345 RepID=A0ABD0KY22_9CAEN